MAKHLFKVSGPNGLLPIKEIEREAYPVPGDYLTVFNYPAVSRYVVLGLEPRTDVLPVDWFEPQRLVLGLVEELERAVVSKVVSLNPARDIRRRLEAIAKIALSAITSKLRLEISHADFVDLCQASGLSSDVMAFDAIAYYDIPVGVGGDGEEWNASTCFTGHSDEMHVFYVTLPGGDPFIMNGRLLEIASARLNGYLNTDKAFQQALKACFEAGTDDSEALRHALHQTLELIFEGIMPLYDGAQELTRISARSQVRSLERAWLSSQSAETERADAPGVDRVGPARHVDFDFTLLFGKPSE